MKVERVTGRILSVWEQTLGSTLAANATVAATTITVDDASAFNDDGDGGWLQIGDGGQVVAYTDVDDDTGVITLVEAVTDLVEEGEDVAVWSDLYGQVDTAQFALVVVDGKHHNDNPLLVTVADTVSDLANGDRGRAREACVIERDGDEWIMIRVPGRPSKSIGHLWEADDNHLLTPTDVSTGSFTYQLSHVPVPESVQASWEGIVQRPTDFSYDINGLVTWTLDGAEPVGSRFDFHYEYIQGLTTSPPTDDEEPPPPAFEAIPYGSTWKVLTGTYSHSPDPTLVATYSDAAFDDTAWASSPLPIGTIHPTTAGYSQSPSGPWPALATTVASYPEIWIRRELPAGGKIKARPDADVWVYWNGVLKNGSGGWLSSSGLGVIYERPTAIASDVPTTVTLTGAGVLLIFVSQHIRGGTDGLYVDIEVTAP